MQDKDITPDTTKSISEATYRRKSICEMTADEIVDIFLQVRKLDEKKKQQEERARLVEENGGWVDIRN